MAAKETLTYCGRWWGVIVLMIVLWASLITADAGATTFLYKQYVIQQDLGRDILCEPYQVQKNDWVYKIFRRKGEIAEDDFPNFIQIFQRINPHITDLDRIEVGDRILIPLKKIEAGAEPPDSASNLVAIPFVTVSKATADGVDNAVASPNPQPYQVKPGDTVHRLIATQFGPPGTPDYAPAVARFEELNPQIKNLDRIFVGQVIKLPTKEMFTLPPAVVSEMAQSPSLAEPSIMELKPPTLRPVQSAPTIPAAPLDAVATLLGGGLKKQGKFHFPASEGTDVVIDVARTPVLELPAGRRLLVTGGDQIPPADLAVVRKYWPDLQVLTLDSQTNMIDQLGRLLNAYGAVQAPPHFTVQEPGLTLTTRTNWVLTNPSEGNAKAEGRIGLTFLADPAEQTPAAIGRYLAGQGLTLHEIVARDSRLDVLTIDLSPRVTPAATVLPTADERRLVTELVRLMGFVCVINSQITFTYSGMELSAWVDVVQNADGQELLLNFGQIQGDAVNVLQASGIRVVDLPRRTALRDNLVALFQALDVSSTYDPVFWAATRPATYNTSITAAGLLASPLIGRKFLITPFAYSAPALQIFQERGIQVIQLAMTARQRKLAGWG